MKHGNMKIAYLDCFSGISGDMCLGALVDAGVPLTKLFQELKKIPVSGYTLSVRSVKRNGMKAKKVTVTVKKSRKKTSLRRWKDIEKIVRTSSLAPDIKKKGLRVYKKIIKAESSVHGSNFRGVHLHELGAVDCLVDIFGTIIGFQMLGVEKVYSSAINLGTGSILSEHGFLPVPAPATVEILKNVPVYSNGVAAELTTPTGAALVHALSSAFSSMPEMSIQQIGIGAGSTDFSEWPNILRIFIGEEETYCSGANLETVTIIETNIDDMNPQIFEHVIDMLYKAGAIDVALTQVIMKKGRPGVIITVISDDIRKGALMDILLKETSTIGLRFYKAQRKVLSRKIREVSTDFGTFRIKTAGAGGIRKITPEYEDMRKIAEKKGIPLIDLLKKIKIPE